MINIAVINESTSVSNTAVQALIPAFTTQWNRDLAPLWGLDKVAFTFVPKGQVPVAGSWWLVWLDNADQANALAYHDLTDEGLPLSKVFVKTIQADGASLSVAATHELCEMAVDPTINLAAQDETGTFWAYECADPVEDDQYGYDIDGVTVTDFVLPAWFGYKNASGPYDFRQQCTGAFQILSGGYAQQFGADGWIQVNGDKVKKAKSRVASLGSRRERRRRGARGALRRSESRAR